jgi:signal transduction histidine kinase/DNA-binding response OmpR family regulator
MASAGVALFLACAAFVASELLSIRAEMVRRLATEAQLVGSHSTSALVFQDPEAATTTLSALQAEPYVVWAAVYGKEGSLFASFARKGAGPIPPRAPEGEGDAHAFGAGTLRLHHRMDFDGARIGTVVIESDLGEMTGRLGRYGAIAFFVLLASLVVAQLTARRMQHTITEPVTRLVEAARRVSADRDYAVRVPPRGDDELGLLTRSFNDMLGQIQERDGALQEAREALERKVEERTEDLQKEVRERRALEDVLRKKNAELEEQSRRVQEATRLKSEFLANMSHELRTPLNAIIGFAELMHDGKVGPVSEQHVEFLGDILTSSRHLLQLINDVLDLSKVEAGKMEFRPEPVDLERLVFEVQGILRTMSAKKRIRVSAEVSPEVGTVVLDPGKLKQVLYNYLSNALKFTPEGGRVEIRARPHGPDHFELEVEDTGIGIRPEDVGRLFAEFQQLDASSSKAHPGTGLGLALTKRMVEAQAGHVGVRSTPGSGSLFFAVLPRVFAVLPSEDEPPSEDTVRPGAPTILVVEDDAKERAWLQKTLAYAGYTVECATSGADAIEKCAKRSFDGITLDLFLSDMSGWDVLREIRARGPNVSTPTIVVTVIAEKGAAAGFAIHDYLLKPVEPEVLVQSLSQAGVPPASDRPVLVVDDDAQARRLLATILETHGYRISSAASGVEGLSLLEGEAPSAVILDLVMPEMDGFEFLERFRRSPRGRDTPVIVWTAKDLSSDERGRLAAAAHAVVLKIEGGTDSLVSELKLRVPVTLGSEIGP